MELNFSKFNQFIESYAKPRWENQSEEWPLRTGGGEVYIQKKIIEKTKDYYKQDKIEENVKNSLLVGLKVHVNLLSRFEFSHAKKFIELTPDEKLGKYVVDLFYGEAPLIDRLRSFLEWAKVERIKDSENKKGINPTVCSYFLALSNPHIYPYCKPTAYDAAIDCLELKDLKKSDPIKRIIHCQSLYKGVLDLLEREYGLQNGNLFDVHSLFYLYYTVKKEKAASNNYWQIAPGEGARLWPDFLNNSIAAVGYSKFDFDIRDKSKDELYKFFRKNYPDHPEHGAKIQTTQLWNFLNLKPGDKFITNIGQKLLLGVGVVKSGYLFRSERDEYKHTVDVEYYKVVNDGIPIPEGLKGKFGKTIVPLSKNDFETLEKLFPEGKKKMKSIEHTLNQILCGPPGTGKTYKTINYSLAIIENGTLDEIQTKESNEGRRKLIEIFNNYKKEGQIEFITFHQNFAYEDFIQGLRPQVDSSGKSLSFELKDGVFKRIADRALNNYKAAYDWKINAKQKPLFEKVFQGYFKEFFDGMQETVEIKMKKVSYHITEISEKSIFFVKHSGGSGHTLSINTLSDYYEQGRCTMESGLRTYYVPLLQELIKYSQTLSIEATREDLKNFVIVIDEINRANISRVFGELITLIEDDKRFGQINEMRATLPSGESFSVPPNLFIIGTMNTADKSIALLDIALRRRFEFIKIYPNSDLVITDYKELFDKMNQKIIELRGPDFQIGHAYFMGNEHQKINIKDVMDKKIIPLLYEYFMNDGDAVSKVLTAAGIKTVENSGLYEFESL